MRLFEGQTHYKNVAPHIACGKVIIVCIYSVPGRSEECLAQFREQFYIECSNFNGILLNELWLGLKTSSN